MRLACVGDVGIDDYANLGLRRPGGIALNVAANGRACGLAVSLVGAVGDDPDGDALLAALAPLGLDAARLRRLPGTTPRQAIRLEADGERRFAGYEPGVLRDWRLDAADLAFLAGHDAVFAPLADGLEAVFAAVAHLPGPAVKAADYSVDSALADGGTPEESLRRYAGAFDVNVLGGGREHLPLIEELAAAMPERVFVLTLGGAGAVAFAGGRRFAEPALAIARVVDTTGCGDAFQAAFLAAYLRSRNIPAALRAGAARAAHVAARVGANELTLP